jgi:hypothetical protein
MTAGLTASGHRNGLEPGSKALKSHSDPACSGGRAKRDCSPVVQVPADSAVVVDDKKAAGHREVPRLRSREKL